jgi:hypothetical protein
MAIVSATLQHNHAEASAMADELHAAEARFGLVVAAQFLTDAVRTISSTKYGRSSASVPTKRLNGPRAAPSAPNEWPFSLGGAVLLDEPADLQHPLHGTAHSVDQ